VSSIAVAKIAAETGFSLAGVDRNFSSDGVSDTGERILSASRLAEETTLIGEVSRVLTFYLLYTAGPIDFPGVKAVTQRKPSNKTTSTMVAYDGRSSPVLWDWRTTLI
jgi:hypothetical protein